MERKCENCELKRYVSSWGQRICLEPNSVRAKNLDLIEALDKMNLYIDRHQMVDVCDNPDSNGFKPKVVDLADYPNPLG